MGHNICMLAERPASEGLYHDHAVSLELMECVHFHVEDFRFVWTMDEFLFIADIFEEAKKQALALNKPQSSPTMIGLCSRKLPGSRMHTDRLACEMTTDTTVHFHNKSLRTHFTSSDFYDLTESMKEAGDVLCDKLRQKINLINPPVYHHPIVEDYLKILDEYKRSSVKILPDKIGKLSYDVKFYARHPKGKETTENDLQRPDGRLPQTWSGKIPLELDKEYLCAMYESIKQWGYADGPFYNQLMPAYKTDKGIYLKGSHRTAALLSLGIQEVDVLLVDPPIGYKC